MSQSCSPRPRPIEKVSQLEDIDILATFAPDAQWGLFDHLQMEKELSDSLGRKVDILTKRSVERSPNWLLRDEILSTAEVVYES